MKITRLLSNDHEAVLKKLAELESASGLLRGDVKDNELARVMLEVGEFIETDVAAHFAQEETLLFAALDEIEGMREGPLKMMRYEHDRFRELQVTFQEQTQALRFGNLVDGEVLANVSKKLVDLLRDHIQKEDTALFPLCEKYLSSSLLEDMGRKVAEELAAAEAAETVELDIRSVDIRQRHPLILETFDKLSRGHQIRLVNDHDPKPLHYQFEAERQGKYGWKNLEQGPERWVVVIRKVA